MIHVLDETSVEQAVAVEPFVDALLLDSGNPDPDVKVLGGKGRKHNWDISRETRKNINIPLFPA